MNSSTSAFVPAAAPLAKSAFTTRSPVCARPVAARPTAAFRFAPAAILGNKKVKPVPESKVTGKFNRIEQNRQAKLSAIDTDPQGFTSYSEKVNGRLAMMFFVIGLFTEVVSHRTMSDQILIMFSPLTSGLEALAQTLS
jgi:hypothetical protein